MFKGYKNVSLILLIVLLLLMTGGVYGIIKEQSQTQEQEDVAPTNPPVMLSSDTNHSLGTPKTLTWRRVYDKQGLVSAAYGNGSYVAVGNKGMIKFSSDGISWHYAPLQSQDNFNSVIYDGSKFIAAGTGILTSANGEHWQQADISVDGILNALAYNGSVYVAAGQSGKILVSSDGLSWRSVNQPGFENINFSQIVTNGSEFVAMEENGDTLYVSENGESWSNIIPGTDYKGYTNLAANNGRFYIYSGAYQSTSGHSVSAFFLSEDGVNWTKHENPPFIRSITTGENRFIGIGGYPEANLSVSEDGLNWQITPIPDYVYYSGAKFFWLNGMYITFSPDGAISVSEDGFNWRSAEPNADSPFQNVIYENGKLSLPISETEGYNSYGDTATNGQIYVRVGGKRADFTGDGAFDTINRTISTSADGVNWSTKTEENKPPLNKVAYGNGTFVAVGDNSTILTSKDGGEWESHSAEFMALGDVLDIVWDGTRFIASGQNVLMHSADGITWEQYNPGAMGDTIYQIFWNEKRYIGVGLTSIIIADSAVSFSDMENHWAKEHVEKLAAKGIINGVDQNTFAPDRDITRAEFAALVVRAFNLTSKGTAPTFADVNIADWYYSSISIANENGIISGYGEGVIKPENPIIRQEAMAMVARAMNNINITEQEQAEVLSRFKDNDTVAQWAKAFVAMCVKNGIVQGSDSMIMPNDNITRAETATIIWKATE